MGLKTLLLLLLAGTAQAQVWTVVNSTRNPLSVTVTNFPAGGDSVYVTNPTTSTVSGSVSVSNLFNGTTVYVVNPTTASVTGSVSVSNLYNGTTVYVVNNTTSAVTGTFWQVTQPVSIAAMPSTPVTGTFFQATQPVSGNVFISSSVRTSVMFYVVASTVGATGAESNLTLTKSAGTAATSALAKHVLTLGKRLRIQSISIGTRGNATATIQTTTFNLRLATNGICITSSTPILFSDRTATAAVASDWDRHPIDVPDGYELVGDGTAAICMSVNSTYVTNAPTADVLLIGYEY